METKKNQKFIKCQTFLYNSALIKSTVIRCNLRPTLPHYTQQYHDQINSIEREKRPFDRNEKLNKTINGPKVCNSKNKIRQITNSQRLEKYSKTFSCEWISFMVTSASSFILFLFVFFSCLRRWLSVPEFNFMVLLLPLIWFGSANYSWLVLYSLVIPLKSIPQHFFAISFLFFIQFHVQSIWQYTTNSVILLIFLVRTLLCGFLFFFYSVSLFN